MKKVRIISKDGNEYGRYTYEIKCPSCRTLQKLVDDEAKEHYHVDQEGKVFPIFVCKRTACTDSVFIKLHSP